MLVIFIINRSVYTCKPVCARACRCGNLGLRVCGCLYPRRHCDCICVHTCNVRIRVDLRLPVHVYGFPGTLFMETSWAAATWSHSPVPRGCSGGYTWLQRPRPMPWLTRLLISSTTHRPRDELGTWSLSSLCLLQVLSAPPLSLSVCSLPSLSPLTTAIASCPL